MDISQKFHSKYRPDIDGLRAIAVLAVVAFHAFPGWLRGGFTGVDIFFVISGYLISSIIFENLDNKTFTFSDFYSRRITRIFPALITVLVFCYAVGWFVLLADEYQQLGKHIVAGAGFISNFILWQEVGYFDNLAETKPLLHLWSLGVEEQFYIFWPLLLWLYAKKSANWLVPSITVALISFCFNIEKINSDPIAAFYSPQARYWELMVGGILAWATLYKRSLNSLPTKLGWFRDKSHFNSSEALNSLASLLGVVLITFGFFGIHKGLNFPGVWALIPVIGAALILWAGPNAWINRIFLSNKLITWFGLISYPLYLWHWPLLAFGRIYLGEFPNKVIRLGLVLLSIVLAWLTYRFIERPIRFEWKSNFKVIILIICMAATALVAYGTFIYEGLLFRALAKQSLAFQYSEEIPGYITCAMKSDFKKFLPNDIDLNYCVVNKHKSPNAIIIGDSHAEDKFHGLVRTDQQHEWMLMGNSNCPPVLGIQLYGEQKACKRKFEFIYSYLENNPGIKDVAISFYGVYFRRENYSGEEFKNELSKEFFAKESSHGALDYWQKSFYAGLDLSIHKLIANGKRVTLIIDVPEMPASPRDCIRSPHIACQLDKESVLKSQQDARQMIAQLQKSNPKLRVYDPSELLCRDGICSFKLNETILYRDSHHLTLGGSIEFAKHFLMLNSFQGHQ